MFLSQAYFCHRYSTNSYSHDFIVAVVCLLPAFLSLVGVCVCWLVLLLLLCAIVSLSILLYSIYSKWIYTKHWKTANIYPIYLGIYKEIMWQWLSVNIVDINWNRCCWSTFLAVLCHSIVIIIQLTFCNHLSLPLIFIRIFMVGGARGLSVCEIEKRKW